MFHVIDLNCRLGAGHWTVNFLSVFCTLVTHAEGTAWNISMITFHLTIQIVFLFDQPLFFLTRGRQKQRPMGTHNEGEMTDITIICATASKPTFQKVTGGKCWLHPVFINMKLKVTMYICNERTYLRPPALLPGSASREKSCLARSNSDYFDARKSSFIWALTR